MADLPDPPRFLFAADTSASRLQNPSDLARILAFFDGLGYQAQALTDPTADELESELLAWATSVSQRSAAAAVVYLTGHVSVESGRLSLHVPYSNDFTDTGMVYVPEGELLGRAMGQLDRVPVLVILDTDYTGEALAPEDALGPFRSRDRDIWIINSARGPGPTEIGSFVRAFTAAAASAMSSAGPLAPYVSLEMVVDDMRKELNGQPVGLSSVKPLSEPAPFIPNPNYQAGLEAEGTAEEEPEPPAETAETAEPAEPEAVPPVALLAGYAADTVAGADELGITQDVESLCSVLMATTVKPPLSVGLFGDWGAGKSFFMQRMRERIDWLAAQSKLARDEGRRSDFCENVRQITFNAWHYVDANLWASLITRIFDGLLGGTDDQLEPLTPEQVREQQRQAGQVLAKLESAELFAAEARRQRDLAELQLREQLQQQEASAGKLQSLSDLTAADIKEVAQQHPDQVKQALGGLSPQVQDSLDTLAVTYGLWGTLRDIWAKLDRRARRQTVLLGLLAAALVVVGVIIVHSSWRTAPIVAAVVSLAGVVARSRPGLERSRAAARSASQTIDQAIAGQQAVAHAEAARLQAEIDATQARLEQADAEIAGIRDGRRIGEFIAARAASTEYQRGLGIIALVRRDLARLSQLMSDPGGGQPQQIDRIVLYIDDLDRCPAERVAEVLQAVHLLLAFPLFIVVVGADARWLLRSLELQYADLMTAEPGPGPDEDPEMALHWSATPQNYLDKIFQIPFSLKPMDAAGFERLVRATAGAPEAAQPAAPDLVPPAQDLAGPDVTTDAGPDEAQSTAEPGPAPAPAPIQVPLISGTQATRVSGGRLPGRVLGLALTEDNQLVATSRSGPADPGVTVTTLDGRSGELRRSWATRCEEAALSPDGALVASRTADGLQLAHSSGLHGATQYPGTFSGVGFSVDGSRLTALAPGMLHVIDIDGRIRSERPVPDGQDPALRRVLPSGRDVSAQAIWARAAGDEEPLRHCAFSRDGSTAALAGGGRLLVVSLPDGTIRQELLLDVTDALAISPDGSMIAAIRGPVADDDVQRIVVLDPVTGVPHWQAGVRPGTIVPQLAFSANGRLLASSDEQGHVQVRSLASATADLSARQLQLTEPELAFLARLAPLIRTPRAAKRLVNVYRLLRAPLDQATLAALLGEAGSAAEYPAVLLLLTIVTGFPDPAQAIIGGLLQAPGGTWPEFVGQLMTRSHGASDDPVALRWRTFLDAYDQLNLTGLPQDIDVYATWAPLTARYSFRTGRLLG